MRNVLLLAGFQLFAATIAFSQAQLASTEIQKKERQAVLRYVSFTPEVVDGAVKMRLDEMGNRGRENKNLLNLGKGSFYQYKGVTLPREQNPVDLFIKVEPRFKKDQSESSIFLVMLKPTGDFASSETDPELMEKAKVFFEGLRCQILFHRYLCIALGKGPPLQEALLSKATSFQGEHPPGMAKPLV